MDHQELKNELNELTNELEGLTKALKQTQPFLDLLPEGKKPDSVSMEDDGSVEFEWYENPKQLLSVSITPNGNLCYAVIKEEYRDHGVIELLDECPAIILELIDLVRNKK
jgi:hypothetical protein